ncbi:MAG: type III-A CRISPR-associated protein Cas10/Csm1 [Nitrospinae bacterium]|nr:type III-A CRISPR-associated protein Cas10/Csm1 [Nitrospinota bacterium]
MNEKQKREYYTVILGALLHDVGKMLQRGSFGSLDTKGQHPQVSSDFVSAFKEFFSKFVDFDLFKTLVQRHHEDPRYFKENLLCQNAPEEYKALSYLVSRADNYSSSERGEKAETYQDFKATPMVSIFSRIKLNKDMPEQHRYRLNPLMPKNAFPEKFNKYEDNEVNKHLQSFGKEFKQLVEDVKQADFDAIFSNILTILMQYSWCIPSNTQEDIPDVSLYDHLKTTCAIAACLYQYHSQNFKEGEIKDDKTKKFILLVGDLSGIQNYIFNITHIGAGGVAKRLRARSFQLNMMSEIISHKILHAFNLPLANMLMASGGKFYMLLPNTKNTADKIKSIKQEVDLWFYKNLNAEINLNIATMPLSGNDFKNYSGVMKNINHTLQQIKKIPFQSIITDNGLWKEDVATLDIDFGEEGKLCKACKKFPGEEREDEKFICNRCYYDKEIGQILPKVKYVAFYKNEAGEFKDYLGYSFDLLNSTEEAKTKPYLVLSTDEPTLNYKFPLAHRFIANYVSKFISPNECDACESDCSEKDNVIIGQPKFFECIASESTGRKMLGYLKADVDNLGAVFTFGLKENGTVSRIATLSRMLDIFFSGYMQKLMEDNYPEIYTVYSGGDDMLVIGPWDSIINFANELNSEFNRFTCNNENITLSAGIAFVKHNYPVFRAVETADNALDTSKDSGKDRLTVFGQTVKWDDVPSVIEEADKLKKWLEQESISSGFARNLLIYSQMNNEFIETRKTEHLRFLPLMTYDIARNLPSLENKDAEKREIRLWAESIKDLKSQILKSLGIIASYALTANRGKNE